MLNKLHLLTPGPTPLPEAVRLALSKDMIHHRKKEFAEIMCLVQKSLMNLFGTQEAVLPLSCSGTGAMTAAVYSLFNPNEKVLVIEAGKFGERWKEIALSRKLSPEVLSVEWGKAADPEQVINIINKNPDIKGILMQLCETSTGVLQPVHTIAQAVKNKNCLLVADGISAVGISPAPMDFLGIDCLLTGSQKGLMLPPGLALIALSAKAWQKAEQTAFGCYYFNLIKERDKLKNGQTLFTTPVNLIMGLKASLDLMLEKGLDEIYRKQWALTMLVRRGCIAMGLELLADINFAWGVTSVKMPKSIDAKIVLDDALTKFGICMAGGQERLKGKIIRIGHMGWVDWTDCIAALTAIASILEKTGQFKPHSDFLAKAMEAYENALQSYPDNIKF